MDELLKLQVQAYLSEYQAMMTRINWFMSMQFMPVAPLIAFFAFITVAHNLLNDIVLVWGAAVVTQIAILVYYFALHEVYNHVRYLETELKPRLAALLQLDPNNLWGWERYLKKVGKAHDPRFGDFSAVVFSAISFVAAGVIAQRRATASNWDVAGMFVTGALLFGAVLLAVRVARVRKDFETAA